MRKLFSLLMVLLLCAGLTGPAGAAGKPALDTVVSDTAKCVYRNVKNPQVGSVGGEWAVFGLARSGYDVPQPYYDAYYKTVEKYVKDCQGVLDDHKYTEYSRVILSLLAAGFDPCDVAGYDLTLPLGDFDKTIWQGINGPIFALLVLDGAGYNVPFNPKAATQATRELYIQEILSRQLPDGGFALSKSQTSSDADITGMALQALAKYQDRDDVKKAIDSALDCLADMKGGFVAWGAEGSESVVQVIVALCELGTGIHDPRFMQNDYSLLDKLMEYYVAGQGFKRSTGGNVDQMATEQALYALAALDRFEKGLAGLYDMSDVDMSNVDMSDAKSQAGIDPGPEIIKKAGLPGKHEDIQVMPVIAPGKSFADVAGHKDQAAIEALAARGMVGGKSEAHFEPGATMTRAEFASIITRGLALPAGGTNGVFDDVRQQDWFSGPVGAAYKYGIANGISATTFNPQGIITREEAAAMITKAAALCGMDTALEEAAVRDLLAQFGDYVHASAWASGSLAFCYQEGILSSDVFNINPKEAVKRGEIAGMLYRMLARAELL